jgi:hypothetical protein
MKRIFTIAAALMMTASVWAQAPDKMSYQAVVRDASDALVATQVVGMQISILQGGSSGTAVYIETQTPKTNANGLVSIEIGTGTEVSGDFTTIDWANDTYFIKTETDPTGGTTYTITGTSQLMSVPYALHANTADSIVGGVSITETDPVFRASIANGITALDTTNWNNHTVDTDTQLDSTDIANLGYHAGGAGPFHLGKDTLGGIVYYIYIGSDGNQHGLIVNKTESTAVWQVTATLTYANRSWDGAFNTALMTSSAAANYVNGLSDGGFFDWYLPSIDETSSLWRSRLTTNKALNAIGGATLLSSTAYYWSSTEYYTTAAFTFNFYTGVAAVNASKANLLSVRAVRAF